MTIQTTPAPHFPIRSTVLALAGGVLAVALGYGVAGALLDDPVAPAPVAPVVEREGSHPFVDGTLGNAMHQKTTDWEERLLMHRR